MNKIPEAGGMIMVSQDRIVFAMALTRLLAGSLELTAAFLMLAWGRVETAFRINALLGLVGPLVFLTVSALGLTGLVGRVSGGKLLLIIMGIILILMATRK